MADFKTTKIEDKNGSTIDGSFGALKTVAQTRLIGTVFDGANKNTNFWEEAVTGSGSVSQDGEVILSTGVTADSTVMYQSVQRCRKTGGSANQFRCVARLSNPAEADNLRRIGVYDANDGVFFQVNGTTFGIGVRKDTSDTIVNSGDFNGDYGASVTMDTDMKRLTITMSELNIKFMVNDIVLHTITATTTSNVGSLSLPITMENNNSNGNTTDNAYEVLFASVVRLGPLTTEPIGKYQSGTVAELVLKNGAGDLRGLMISAVANNSVVTLYDNTGASGTIIWSSGTMPAKAEPFYLNFFGLSFSTGLTLTITGATSTVTVIYE